MRVLILLLMFSCGRDNKPKPTENPLAEVQAKRDLYIELAKAEVDAYGWLQPRCDGLLFNSLAAYSGFPVDPLIAEESPGKWQRHPDFACMGNGSKSQISKDMFRGIFIYLLATKDCQNAKEIYQYGEDHGWKMGEAVDAESVLGRVMMTPSMTYQLGKIVDKLCGTHHATTNFTALQTVTVKKDFEKHLDVLGIFTEYLIHGGVSNSELEVLKSYAKESPRNALFQILSHKFTDGDMTDGINIILDESLFPADRLPNEHDHYTHYLWQREPNEDWQPCTEGGQRFCEGITHPGIDLIFAVKIMEQ